MGPPSHAPVLWGPFERPSGRGLPWKETRGGSAAPCCCTRSSGSSCNSNTQSRRTPASSSTPPGTTRTGRSSSAGSTGCCIRPFAVATGQATAEVRAAAPALEKAAIRKYAVKGWEDDACFDTLSPEVETARYGWWWSDEAKGREGQILKTVAGRQAGRQAGLLSASTHSSTHQQCRLSSANFIFISVWRHIGHKSA